LTHQDKVAIRGGTEAVDSIQHTGGVCRVIQVRIVTAHTGTRVVPAKPARCYLALSNNLVVACRSGTVPIDSVRYALAITGLEEHTNGTLKANITVEVVTRLARGAYCSVSSTF